MTRADYGDATGEYLALRTSCGVVEGVHDLVWVRGPDTVRFLDGLLSRALDRLDSGSAGRSLLLSPQGKLRATLWCLVGDEEVGLVADAGRGDVIVEDLNRFKIRVDVDIIKGDAVVDVWGPTASAVLESAGISPPDAEKWTRRDGGIVASLPFQRSSLPRYVMTGVGVADLAAAGAVRAGGAATTAVRIEVGEPVTGVDLDERTIPQEADVVDGSVDFDKGCYLGQELVARIDSRGHVNRHLRGIVVDTNVLPPQGAEVRVDDATVGRLSSVAESLELRAPIALALIRREVQPGSRVVLHWDGGEAGARVEALPLDGIVPDPA